MARNLQHGRGMVAAEHSFSSACLYGPKKLFESMACPLWIVHYLTVKASSSVESYPSLFLQRHSDGHLRIVNHYDTMLWVLVLHYHVLFC